MKRQFKHLLIGSLLGTTALLTMAQGNPTPAGGMAAGDHQGMHSRMGHGDHEQFQTRMRERHAKDLSSLKSKLQLSAAQESAWTTFSNAMQPPATPPSRMNRSEMEKLNTPERIDQMRTHMSQRDDFMRQRGDATKTFYAALNAAQKKIFDAETLHRGGHGQHRGH